MIELSLRLRSVPDGRIFLELGIVFRLVFGTLAAVLGVGMAGGESVAVIPAVALAVLILGALYREQWELDPTRRTIIARHGLIGISRRRRWSFDEIECVEYTHYRAGSIPGSEQSPPGDDTFIRDAMSPLGRVSRGMRRHFLRYTLVTREGRRVRVEIRRVRSWSDDVRLPRTLAETIGVPLVETPI